MTDKARFLPGHLNVPTNTARNLNGDDTIWSCCGNRVEEGHSADCKRHPPASSPETPAEEVMDAVNDFERALCLLRDNQNADEGEEDEPYDSAIDRYDAKRAALLALYNRQREEAEDAYQELQLTKERFIAQSDAEIASLSSQLERLKAEPMEQLTRQEADFLLGWIERVRRQFGLKLNSVEYRGLEKLRLRSLSHQKK